MKALLIFILSLIGIVLNGQGLTSFEITQATPLSGRTQSYSFDGENLYISENGNPLDRIVINEDEHKRLDSVFNALRIDTLRNNYSRNVMDGVYHSFHFEYNEIERTISLGNYYHERLDHFLFAVNNLIDNQLRLISLGEELLSAPDTIVLYAPFIPIDSTTFPKQYDSYTLLYFGRLNSDDILPTDTVKKGVCNWSGADENGEQVWRRNFRVYRQRPHSWRIVYYNEEAQVIKREYHTEILPLEVVKEEVNVLEGVKPSVEITRYFRLSGFGD
ncbi:MAG: hypothetical protein HWE14_06990 [Flavobacteriia bacterium]|nr:hypothetical protein [Flavobacteriia bacterium]